MGYPMTWRRLVERNGAEGGYDGMADRDDSIGAKSWARDKRPGPQSRAAHLNHLAGDMRRLEADSRDEHHLKFYADMAGISPDQVKIVLDAFFSPDWFVKKPAEPPR